MIFFFGYVIGFLTALMFLYLIRREVEQVANGERVATNKPKKPIARLSISSKKKEF